MKHALRLIEDFRKAKAMFSGVDDKYVKVLNEKLAVEYAETMFKLLEHIFKGTVFGEMITEFQNSDK